MCSSFFFFFRAYNFSLRVWRVLLSERRSQTCWDYSERQKRGLQYRPCFGNQKHRTSIEESSDVLLYKYGCLCQRRPVFCVSRSSLKKCFVCFLLHSYTDS